MHGDACHGVVPRSAEPGVSGTITDGRMACSRPCVWLVPLDPPASAQAGAGAVQLRLIGDEGGDGREPTRGAANRPLARKRVGAGR